MLTKHPKAGFVLLVVTFALAALLSGALSGTTWAAPNAACGGTVSCTPTPTQTQPSGGGGGGGGAPVVPSPTPQGVPSITCPVDTNGTVCALGDKAITLPPGAFGASTLLALTGPLSQPPCPATPSGELFLGDCFKVEFKAADGTLLATNTAFASPATDCLRYSPTQVTLAGGDAKNFRIGLIFDPSTLVWTVLTPTVDAVNTRVCVNVGKVFFWNALLTPAPGLPVTGGIESVPSWAWLAGLGLLGVALTLGGRRVFQK